MNSRVLVAGWPFAGLLALEAERFDATAGAAERSGVIAREEGGGGILVCDPCGTVDALDFDAMTALYGVDGYPISPADIHVGDVVRVVQEQRGSRRVTREVRILRPCRPAPSGIPPRHGRADQAYA